MKKIRINKSKEIKKRTSGRLIDIIGGGLLGLSSNGIIVKCNLDNLPPWIYVITLILGFVLLGVVTYRKTKREIISE